MKQRADIFLIFLLILLPILFHWRILTPNVLDRGAFPQGDFVEQFYAFARFAYDELAQGRLPLWNPHTYAGHPFLADVQSAIFYPPALVIMGLASRSGGFSLDWLAWQAVLHFSLAGVATFFFARHSFTHFSSNANGWAARSAAWLSAITFTFSGYLTSYPSQQLAILETDVWLPLILLCLSKAFSPYAPPSTTSAQSAGYASRPMPHASARERRWLWTSISRLTPHASRSVTLAGFCFGIALLAGHPQSALYVLLVSMAFAFFHGRQQLRRWREIALALTWMLFIALGVSAAQWLPSLEFMQFSSRANLSYADYARGFELFDPLQLLLPGSVSVYSPLYVGIAPLALALCALWLPRRAPRVIAFWFVLALLALLLSFGGNLFFYPILYLFAPGFAIFRQQERAAFVFAFALAMLAGYGLLLLMQVLPRDAHRRLRGFARLSLGAGCGALLFFLLTYFAWQNAQLARASAFRDASNRAMWLVLMLGLLQVLWQVRLRGVGRHIGLPPQRLGRHIGLPPQRLGRHIGLPPQRLGRHIGLPLLFILMTMLDLFTINWQINFQPTAPDAQTRPPTYLAPILADQAAGTPFRTFNEYRIFGNFGNAFGLEDTWGASPLRLARYEQFHKLPMQRIWALLNVKYVITWRQSLGELGVESEVIASEKISEKETTYVHRLKNVAPRAALVSRVRVMADQAALLQQLGAPDFDFAQTVLTLQALNVTDGATGDLQLVARSPGRSLWATRATAPMLFVLGENDYPGWRVFVDGREMPIVRANFVMLATPVPAGEHRVEFVFDPLSVKLGLGLSLLTLLGSLLGGWIAWRRP